MTKYNSNEQYEKDKQNWIDELNHPYDGEYVLDSLDIIELLDFLEQSKWIGNSDDDNTKVDDDA